MSDLLLEIGCENLPAAYVLPAAEQLGRDAETLFEELRLAHGEIRVTGTPRRIVMIVRDLAGSQSSKTQTVTGPPVSRSFDEEGNPTPAAQGFARSQGIAVSKLRTIDTDRGAYLGFTRRLKNRKTVPLLKEYLPGLIAGLKFPKTMRWEASGVRFARPVRWLVALYGNRRVTFGFAGVRSGNSSRTVPWIDGRKIRIDDAGSYISAMRSHGVIVDHEERRETLETLARRAAGAAGLTLVEDATLFDELTFMVEEPYVFIGAFPESYLQLPPEVIITAMKAHQRYFALRAEDGSLVPKFLAFIDGKKIGPAQIRAGNEKVLRARLADALFYWQEDLKRGIDGLADKLGAIVFIEGVGTVEDKAKRLHRLIRFIDEGRPAPHAPSAVLERVARLVKADLASEMVKDGKEFTLLEGLMGSHYARAAGEEDAVVSAIREHQLPRTPSDPLPTDPVATSVSVADKIDSVCGCFLAGLAPTGSQDPYGLRRQAIAVIRLLERYPIVPIADLVDQSIALYREMELPKGADYDTARDEIEQFIRNRFAVFLRDRDIEYDVVNASLKTAWSEPARCIDRARAIQERKRSEEFALLITGVKRVGNIIPDNAKYYGISLGAIESLFDPKTVNSVNLSFSSELFQDEVEFQLLEEVRQRVPRLRELDKKHDINGILATLAELGAPIDRYFDTVLVNCEDMSVRNNRIQFLAALFTLFSRYADFSLIVEDY